MERTTAASYLAGYLDGEGCFSVRKHARHAHNYGPRLTVGSTNVVVLRWACRKYGGSIQRAPARNANAKPLYVWTIVACDLEPLLQDVLPFLRLKKKQAMLLLELKQMQKRGNNGFNTKEQQTRKAEIWKEVRRLNHRGPNRERKANGPAN